MAAQAAAAPTSGVAVADVRAAIAKLLDEVEAQFGPELRFPEHFYWNVPLGEAAEINHKPDLDIGSVADDAESVREFLSREGSEFVSVWHESDHLAGVLRSIARLDPSSPRVPGR